MPTRVDALAVMAKAPVVGTVKTRLVPPLTGQQAAGLCRALLLDQLEHLQGFTSAELYLVYAPESAAPLMKRLAPTNFHCLAQRGGDLGERMSLAFADLWRRGHRSVVLIGSDLPALPLTTLETAFETLAAGDDGVVLGPSRDGGYYLVGMNRPKPQIFADMTWGHDRVLTETIERLARLGVTPALLPEWFDIDRIEDIERLKAVTEPQSRGAVKRTLRLLARLRPPTPIPL